MTTPIETPVSSTAEARKPSATTMVTPIGADHGLQRLCADTCRSAPRGTGRVCVSVVDSASTSDRQKTPTPSRSGRRRRSGLSRKISTPAPTRIGGTMTAALADRQPQHLVELVPDHAAVPVQVFDEAEEDTEGDQRAADQIVLVLEGRAARRAPPLGGLRADGGLARAPSRLRTRSAMGPSRSSPGHRDAIRRLGRHSFREISALCGLLVGDAEVKRPDDGVRQYALALLTVRTGYDGRGTSAMCIPHTSTAAKPEVGGEHDRPVRPAHVVIVARLAAPPGLGASRRRGRR